MIDLFTILTKGGVVLYEKPLSLINLKDALQSFIAQSFILAPNNKQGIDLGPYKFEYLTDNELGLIFVVVYQKILQLNYIEELLKVITSKFIVSYSEALSAFFKNGSVKSTELEIINLPTFEFDDEFTNTLKAIEMKHSNKAKSKVPRRFEETKKYQNTLEAAQKTLDDQVRGATNVEPEAESPRSHRKKNGKKVDNSNSSPNELKKSGRVWDGKVSKAKLSNLDYSHEKIDSSKKSNDTEFIDQSTIGAFDQSGYYDVQSISVTPIKPKATTSAWSQLVAKFTGQTIDQENLKPILLKVKEQLISKNVASEIAEQLCQAALNQLQGVKAGAFQSLHDLVVESISDALKKLLAPFGATDILDAVDRCNGSRAYVMAMIGVNGVGKSTNLSKVCFWLLQNRKKVLVAACDTFRSGAVEQLRTHVERLGKLQHAGSVELFERGYGKDSATIAKSAIEYANKNGFDVVLIDTAGRMQNNEPLMKALAKLVSLNQPDKLIFVGEALVGNEAVDQLSKFNEALKIYGDHSKPKRIDGIILTKFDTIDDKVGAAVSMTVTAKAPILFVGTGQTYTDLKKMNVEHVVSTLLQ